MEGHYDLGNAELAQQRSGSQDHRQRRCGGNYRRVYVSYCYVHPTFVYARQFLPTAPPLGLP